MINDSTNTVLSHHNVVNTLTHIITLTTIAQTLLLTLIFIGVYRVVTVIANEYAHDKNMHG
jgi:hypothetical protein